MSNNVFCIGELLIDFIGMDLNKGLKNGIRFEKKAGGAPANVAAAVSKLGGSGSFLGQVGNDSFGKYLLQVLEEAEIAVDMVKVEGYTTLAFVAIDEKGERDFEFHRGCDGDYSFSNIDLNKIGKGDIIHFGSATGFLEGELKNTYFKLFNYAKENNIFVSFDPNYRDALISEDKIEEFIEDSIEFIKAADFVKLSDEEIKLITKEESIEQGVAKLHQIGAKVVAVTLGSKGTLISVNSNMNIVQSIKIKQVDSTGAGDAFVGAVLKQVAEILDKKSIDQAKWNQIIAYANKVGAITCTNYGAISSIPTAEQVNLFK
jgi:fructokinase